MFRSVTPLVGSQRANVWGLPDSVQRHPTGLLNLFVDSYWGGAELLYVQAGGTIAQNALVVVTPALSGGQYIYTATQAPNTANLGKALQIAMTSMTTGQWGWVMVSGVAPINSTASVAADTAFGITAAGQIGAISSGKQVLGGRIVAPATTTVAINGVANNNSTMLYLNKSADGWFPGVYLSGTGIAAGTTVVDIDPSGLIVTLSAATTAAVNGTVTPTYNNATIFYNVAHINTPIAQGQIT